MLYSDSLHKNVLAPKRDANKALGLQDKVVLYGNLSTIVYYLCWIMKMYYRGDLQLLMKNEEYGDQ